MIQTRSVADRLPAALLVAAACATEPTGPSPTDGDVGAGRPSFATASSLPGLCNSDLGDGELTQTGWVKAWDEDFPGDQAAGLSASDLPQWSLWKGGAWNEELQMYNEGQNLSRGGSVLGITAKRETITGPTNPYDSRPKTFQYTSGRIESLAQFAPTTAAPRVRLMARVKSAAGYGMWPAFWSYGDPWPTMGEIDVIEARGHEPFQYQVAFYYGRKDGRNIVRNSAKVIQSGVSLTDCWHVYEVEWTRDALTYWFDGTVVDIKTGVNVRNLFGKGQKITLNLAVGGSFFSRLDPSRIELGTLQVDWVKVFTHPSAK